MTVTSPAGRVVRDDRGTRLEFVRTYDDPVEEVWSALTEPRRVARWFGDWTGDPTTGTVHVRMTAEDDHSPQRVTIVDCQPPTRLVVELPSPDGPWRISASLHEDEGVTTLIFVHHLTMPYDASIGPGWHYYLDRLGAVVTGTTVPADFDVYYPTLQDAYPTPGEPG